MRWGSIAVWSGNNFKWLKKLNKLLATCRLSAVPQWNRKREHGWAYRPQGLIGKSSIVFSHTRFARKPSGLPERLHFNGSIHQTNYFERVSNDCSIHKKSIECDRQVNYLVDLWAGWQRAAEHFLGDSRWISWNYPDRSRICVWYNSTAAPLYLLASYWAVWSFVSVNRWGYQ